MNQALEMQIELAVGGVFLALLTYLAAWVRSNAARLDAHQVALQTQVALNGVNTRGKTAGGGAPAPPAAPLWNQLQDPLPDGSLPAQRFNECGEECCAMEIDRQHGVPLSADALRALLGGPGRGALTTAQDLVRCLALCNVPATAEVVDAGGLAARLQDITAAGGTAMCLGMWVAPSVLHWVLVTRADGAGCGANDPWKGRRRVWRWDEFTRLYAGEIVSSLRPPDAPSSPQTAPPQT